MKAISGVTTVRFKNELVRNITIKLGYANAKVRPSSAIPVDQWTYLLNDNRSTNAKTLLAQDRAATGPTPPTRKNTHLVNVPTVEAV